MSAGQLGVNACFLTALGSGLVQVGGQHTTVAAADTVVTGLRTVLYAVAQFDADPTVDPISVIATIGNQAGTPAAGSIIIKTFKPTAVDNATPVAATTFSKKVNWIAIGRK